MSIVIGVVAIVVGVGVSLVLRYRPPREGVYAVAAARWVACLLTAVGVLAAIDVFSRVTTAVSGAAAVGVTVMVVAAVLRPDNSHRQPEPLGVASDYVE